MIAGSRSRQVGAGAERAGRHLALVSLWSRFGRARSHVWCSFARINDKSPYRRGSPVENCTRRGVGMVGLV
jgi:hypothetical protein